MYPLKFEPILKPLIWGGKKITSFKKIVPEQDGIGESWEISAVSDNVSVVSNGSLKGKSLIELIDTYGADFLGQKVVERFGKTFPLLIKFIDAKKPLSIQVHPNDELAQKRHQSFGKTEMWYVIRADKGATLYSGFRKELNPEEYVKTLEDNTFPDYLNNYPVEAGDAFSLPAGRVHAIGAGCFIAEIQQNSNITYRIYDYNRKDAQGNKRELHTELAKDAIDYHFHEDNKLTYAHKQEGEANLVSCPYFKVNLLKAANDKSYTFRQTDSFCVLMCLDGECLLTDDKNNQLNIRQGETVLVPASVREVNLSPQKEGKILEITIPC